MKKIQNIVMVCLIYFTVVSCQDFLDLKPDKTLVVPSKVKDLQAVLDNAVFMNERGASMGEASADDYYLNNSSYNSLRPIAQEVYTWQLKEYNYENDWAQYYDVIYFCNFVLENLKKIERTPANSREWNFTKGSALFFRAHSYLRLAWLFAPVYNSVSANDDMGVVLRNTTDFNVVQGRSTLKETYDTIIGDLRTAVDLLPEEPEHVMRASKRAAFGYLARAYLSMSEYDMALENAQLALQINDDLMDYNDPELVKIETTRPFAQFNKEVVFQKIISLYFFSNVAPQTLRVDSVLLSSYGEHDLRRNAFFRPASPEGYSYKGTYNGNLNNSFTGLANDELFLIVAECLARLDQVEDGMTMLNRLLINRWKEGYFVPYEAVRKEEAIEIILKERRKELVFRDLRWMDLKRLNLEGRNIVLRRKINDNVFELHPNDKRYALPIPTDIVSDKIQQNRY